MSALEVAVSYNKDTSEWLYWDTQRKKLFGVMLRQLIGKRQTELGGRCMIDI